MQQWLKLIIVISILFLPCIAAGSDVFQPSFDLEIGYDYDNDIFNTDMEFELRFFDPWKPVIFGGIEVLMHKLDGKNSFQPDLAVYDLGFGVEYWFEKYDQNGRFGLYWQHFCIHPADLKRYVIYSYEDLYLQSCDRIFFKMRFDF